jgi:hypothetical protein
LLTTKTLYEDKLSALKYDVVTSIFW